MTKKDFAPGPLAKVSRELGDGDATLVFVRRLRHGPAKVWRALTEPAQQLEWMPFVADRALDRTGPVTLRMIDEADGPVSQADVVAVEPERRLSYSWGDELLTWELAPAGTGTELTLRHRTKTPENMSSFAAGWHICLDVAERFLDGRPVGRIAGRDALDYGWEALDAGYRAKLAAS
ncbi:MAG: SRPBCC family protein [Parvibaculaceae bacterium]